MVKWGYFWESSLRTLDIHGRVGTWPSQRTTEVGEAGHFLCRPVAGSFTLGKPGEYPREPAVFSKFNGNHTLGSVAKMLRCLFGFSFCPQKLRASVDLASGAGLIPTRPGSFLIWRFKFSKNPLWPRVFSKFETLRGRGWFEKRGKVTVFQISSWKGRFFNLAKQFRFPSP